MGRESHTDHPRALVHPHEPHALGGPADVGHLGDGGADDGAVVPDQHHVLIAQGHLAAREIAGLLRQVHGRDALAAPALGPILILVGPLAHAPLGDGEQRAAGHDLDHIHHLVPIVQADGADALAAPARGAHVGLGEADALALSAGNEELVLTGGDLHAHELVPL